jgi:outer membrane protein OmpA-like peptidoglycan-associated protein
LLKKQERENKLAEEALAKELEEQKQTEAQALSEQSEEKSSESIEAKQDNQGKVDWEAIAKERQLIILAYEKDKRERAALEAEQQAQKNVTAASSKSNTVQQNVDVSALIAQNKKLAQENVEMKSQLDEMNAKLDIILVEVRKRNEMAPPVNPYDEEAVSALNSGKKLILQNILFDYNKARLRGSSERELDKLANFLLNNERIKLTISGHTDAIGDSGYNLRLSRARAESVQNYLISRGVSKNRLKAIGFGQSMPIAKNVDGNGDDNPIGRQLNRRIEISVTEGDAGLIQTKEVEIPDRVSP